jgi:hypothetical protein
VDGSAQVATIERNTGRCLPSVEILSCIAGKAERLSMTLVEGRWQTPGMDGWETTAVAPQEGHRLASAEISTPHREQYCIPGLC